MTWERNQDEGGLLGIWFEHPQESGRLQVSPGKNRRRQVNPKNGMEFLGLPEEERPGHLRDYCSPAQENPGHPGWVQVTVPPSPQRGRLTSMNGVPTYPGTTSRLHAFHSRNNPATPPFHVKWDILLGNSETRQPRNHTSKLKHHFLAVLQSY